MSRSAVTVAPELPAVGPRPADFLPAGGPRARLFVDGGFEDAASGNCFATLDPARGTTLAEVAAGDAADVDRAVESARRSFERGSWASMHPRARRKVLLDFAEVVERHAVEIARLDSLDAGKPITDCLNGDLPSVLRSIRWFAESLDKVYGRIAPTAPDVLATIERQPIGVVGAVVPWNYPASTVAGKIAPALAAGNSVVLKPAELAPLSALRLAELAVEAGIPPGVLNVVPGLGPAAGRAVGLHPDVDVVTFTGSTKTGRAFLKYAADSNLKNVVLETGGKSPQLVLADMAGELDFVAGELARAAFSNMGQNCTCGSLILVPESLRDDVVAALLAELPAWRIGDPQHPQTRLGPLISSEQLTKVLDHVDSAVAAGATLLAGGHRVLEDAGGWFVPPTVLSGVTPAMAIFREEVFGPVVSVCTFADEAEAVELANATPYGLAASVFTRDMRTARRVASAIRTGVVSVNCYSEGDVSTPFGGWKQSGFGGKDKGVEAFDQYTELKTIWYSLA